jgi:hypothetical protein
MSVETEDMHMYGLNERVSALESMLSKVNLGDWSNDNDVPYWLAIRIMPVALEQQLLGAVQFAAQARASQGSQAEGSNRLIAEFIDDWCGTPPRKGPPRPHWGVVVQGLGLLGDRFPTGSLLSEAAFDLARRVVNRAHEAHKQVDSQ